jgi:peroxiredoxin
MYHQSPPANQPASGAAGLSLWPGTRLDGWRNIVVLAAIAMVLSLLLAPQLTQSPRTLVVGQSVPDFHLSHIDGSFQLSDVLHRGQPVLLMFYDVDCAPSENALAHLNSVVVARPDLVAVVVNGRAHSARNLGDFYQKMRAAAGPLHFVWGIDPQASLARRYHVPANYPTWYFIEPDGTLAAVRMGEHKEHNLLYRVNEYLSPSSDYLLNGGIK